VQERSLRVYPGDYESFVAMRAGELVRIEAAYAQQQDEIKEMEDFVARNRARASTASRAQNMLKRLERLERVEMPESVRKLTIKLPQPPRSGKDVLTLRNIDKSYGTIPVYKGLNFAMQRGMKAAFVGPNGAGKSTLLKILAGVLPFEGGERVVGHNVTVGYHSQHRLETMDPRRTVYEEAQGAAKDLSEQAIRTVLGSFLFPGDNVYKKVQVLSGGEKSRLSLVKILLEPPNALFLDEPTTHLDIAAVEALITALKAYEGTLAVISHDLFFVNALAEHVVHVDKGQVSIFPGNYELFAWRRKQAGLAAAK
jgi:ATP-binding cassette subfamily F protein 3